MNDLYQSVTNRIISALDAGTPPWIRPWQDADGGIPRNLTNEHPYRGINLLLLNLESMMRGYSDSRWLTFKQAHALGAHVRKGETGAPIVFFKWKEVEAAPDEELPEEDRKVIPLLRAYTVFNAAQIEDLPEKYRQPPPEPVWTPCEAAEDILIHSGAVIRHGGNRAFYRPSDDVVQLPPVGYFPKADDFYAVALHELTHWTGHPSRLNRQLGKRHGIDAYAFEELVAEMGAAFLCSFCRLPARLEHASYIDSWLDALKRDKRLIFVAAGKAQAAADFVLNATEVVPSPLALAA
jgi:antirestriction protein ArdC